MKVLVTGAAGFVGRHIVHECVKRKYTIHGVDDLSTGLHPRKWPEHVRPTGYDTARLSFVEDDIRHYMKHYAKAADYDLIFHCAAIVGGRKMIDGAPLHVATDLSIDAEFFNWCCAETAKPRKVIYFSSSAVYPVELQRESFNVALSEALVRFDVGRVGFPDQTYGWAKLSGEYLMQHAVKHYGLDCVCYRPFSGYGEDQDFSYPFPSIIRRIGRRENPIEVWGTGRQVRDFIHVDDVVDAVFESCVKMKPGETINLGSGIPVSFLDLINMARKVLNHSAEIETLEAERVWRAISSELQGPA